MTRIPSQHLPIPPTRKASATSPGNSPQRSRLLVIPDYGRKPGTPAARPESESTPHGGPIVPPRDASDPLNSRDWIAATGVGDEPELAPRDATPLAETSPRKPPAPNFDTHPTNSQATAVDGESSGTPRPWAPLGATGEGTQRLVAAVGQVRRLVEGLPKRSNIGWQRTILCLIGGAVLAYSVAGGWRPTPSPKKSTNVGRTLARQDPVQAEVERMTRAPLRVDEAPTRSPSPGLNPTIPTTPGTAAAQPSPTDDPIFRMPGITPTKSANSAASSEPGHEAPASESVPASQPLVKEPASPFPVIAAPDGSAVSRRMNPNSASPTTPHLTSRESPPEAPHGEQGQRIPEYRTPTEVEPIAREPIVENRSINRRGLRDHPIANPTFPDPVPPYPHTDPATYRDPEYVLPSVANREHDRSR